MFKKTITAALALMCAISVSAQDTTKHYLIFDLGGGLHNISYTTDGYGSKKMGTGFGAQFGYRYFFNPNWGIGIGVGYNTFSAKSSLSYNSEEQEGIDPNILTEHKERNFHTAYRDVEEKVTLSAIDIPIGVYYKYQLNPKWVVGGGVSAIVSPIAAKKYKNMSGDVGVEASYYYTKDTYVKDVPQHHLSSYSGFSGTPDFKSITFGVGGEVRAYYAINKKIDLSMGVSGAYRFSDIKNANYDRLYNEEEESYVGVTQTAYCSAVKLVNITASVGIRIKLSPKVLPVPTPEIVDVFIEAPYINETLEIIEPPVEDKSINRKNDDFGVNLMPTSYTFVSNALDMSEQLRRKKIGDPIGAPILFASGSARLANTKDNTIMDTVVVFMKENPDVKKLEVSAHTDNMGADSYNLNLSKRRAQTVANYLIKQGVAASRLSVVGYGESRPLNNNATPEERERNRRVEFKILELSE